MSILKRTECLKTLIQVNQREIFLLGRRVVDGCGVRIFARRNKDNQFVIVATNDFDCFDAIALYAKRWEVETLFSCFKGRGFNLENTHLTDLDKMKKLVAIFSIAFCWCYKIGIKKNEEKPIKVKNHGRLSKSLFRLGLDIFNDTMRDVTLFFDSDKFNDLLVFIGLKLFISNAYIE